MSEKPHLQIAMVSGSMPPMPCGVGDNALELARALAARGHQITIYTHQDAAPLEEHHLSVRPLSMNWSWAGCHALTEAIALDKPDLVLIQYPTRGYGRSTGPGLIPLFLKIRHLRAPVVAQLHEFGAAHWLRRLAVWPLLNDSDGLIVPSAQDRQTVLFKHRSLGDRPIRPVPVGPVIPDGAGPAATPEAWEQQLQAWGVPADAFPVLLSYGFVRKDKGLELLAAAIAQLPKTSKAQVVHLGPWHPADDPAQQAVLDHISNKMVIDKFHFVGFQSLSLLPTEPARGTVAIFPYNDGVSDRRSAAITLGTLGYPMISTIPEDEGARALWSQLATLVPRGDAAALAAAIQAIDAGHLPAGNAEGFKARFGWDVVAPQVEAALLETLADYQQRTDPGHVHAAAH